MVGLHFHPVGDLRDPHRGFFGHQFGQQAPMLGIQVLDQDKRHARVLGQAPHRGSG